MLVCIHPNIKLNELGHDTRRFIEILDANGISNELVYAGSEDFWDKINQCDLFIYQWNVSDYHRQIAKSILPIIENRMKIKCYPNSLSSWIYDDKIREYYLLKQHDFPFAKCWIFYDKTNAEAFVRKSRYPIIFKLRSGAGSRMVRMIRNRSEAVQYVNLMFGRGIGYHSGLPGDLADGIRRMGMQKLLRVKLGGIRKKITSRDAFSQDWATHKNYILFQKFMPGNAYDTRVAVVGKRAFAFQRLNIVNDFRASGSQNYNFDPDAIDLKFVDLAFRISRTFGFDTMAYDFLYDENGQASLVEISYAFAATKGSEASKCPGYWDENMNWHPGAMEIPHCILMDLLEMPQLKAS
ncbi:MAG: RimK family alpha-L-glutamate ligase [Candidatus Hodarchaeota archaeon]